jgi:hypothetical protein
MFDFVNVVNTDPFLLFFGGFYIVLGVSAFLAKDAWREVFRLFQENAALNLMMGVVLMPIALSIIVFYNNWDTLSSVVLMVLGCLTLIMAVLMLLCPKVVQSFLRRDFVQKWLWLDGLSGVVLGVTLLSF